MRLSPLEFCFLIGSIFAPKEWHHLKPDVAFKYYYALGYMIVGNFLTPFYIRYCLGIDLALLQ